MIDAFVFIGLDIFTTFLTLYFIYNIYKMMMR